MATTTFERSGLALETTSGTAIAAPTHYLPMTINIAPRQDTYRRSVSNGTRAANNGSKVIHKWVEWSSEPAGIDTHNLPVLLNMACAANTSPSTPSGATTARLWNFARSMTSVTEKTATLWKGDPAVQMFRAAYGYVNGFTIAADMTSADAVTIAMNGLAQEETTVANPAWPSQLLGPMITPLEAQLWIDTSSAIGTTAITGRLVSANFSVDGLRGDPEYYAVGPGASKTFSDVGVNKTAATLALRFAFKDTTQYTQLKNESELKVRLRLNGPLIETVAGPANLYHYVQIDQYGIFDAPDWSDAYTSRRVLDLTVTSDYNSAAATAGHDWAISVMSDRSTL